MPNRLAQEKSPYLLQHAENPVDWWPWGQEALEEARTLDRPIFLSIGYATCHWCHVMAHESFQDPEVARLLNQHFVPIKVDREERPDLDGVYMAVCQALTGRGGWPLSVFLTPQGKPFYAGTYFPKETRYGMPGFIPVLQELARRWSGPERARILEAGEQITKALQPQAPAGNGPELGEATLEEAYEGLARIYDPQHHGFGNAPKFPSPHHLTFLLRWHLRRPQSRALAMAGDTLLAMWRGGMYDQVGLGFHRYSVDAQWLVPHFEKMLYDQAMLSLAFAEAFQLTGREEFGRAFREIAAYVLRDMTAPEGGFYSAEDADSEGEEGRFYVWTPPQVSEALGPELGGLFCRFYGVTPEGNFEHGRSIPHVSRDLAAFAKEEGRDPAQLAAQLELARQRLFALREGRAHPLKDDKVITAWNGLMIAALAKGYQALGDETYLHAAVKAAQFIEMHLADSDGRLHRRWRQGHLSGPGYLDDYAFYAWGLIELYQAGLDPAHLERALALVRLSDELFWDPEAGGYCYTPADGEALIIREKEIYDGATPSGNSAAALNLLRLARLTGDGALEERAQALLRHFAPVVAQQPMAYTQLMNALDFALGPGQEVVVAGSPGAADTQALLRRVQGAFLPRGVLLLRPSDPTTADRLAALAPFTADMQAVEGRATAYLCQNYACQQPVRDPAALDLG
ncbi:MAG: thioredoxin domain-containing protein [Thermodesulfobacteriota bacterium]